MSFVTQTPIVEQVCVKTEARITGYRDITGDEAAKEQALSSGVPSATTLDDALSMGIINNDHVPTPGYALGSNPPYIPDAPPVPLPAAAFLFVGAIAVVWAYKTLRSNA